MIPSAANVSESSPILPSCWLITSADDPRRFVWGNFDNFLSVSYLTPAQTSMVNSAEREKFPTFTEVA